MPVAHGAVEIWAVTLMHATTTVIITLWLLSLIKRGYLIFYRTPIDIPVLIFFSLSFLSIFYSVYPYSSRIELYKLINYALIFYFVINIMREKKKFNLLIWIIAVFGSIYALVGLVLVEGSIIGFRIFSRDNYISFTFVNHNHFAGYVGMVTWLCVGLALSYKGIRRYFLICLGICNAIAVLFSMSRGGILALLSGIFFMLMSLAFFRGRIRNILILGSFSVMILIVLMGLGGYEIVSERIGTITSPDPIISGKSRLAIWSGTLNMIRDNLWFGTGLGTFAYVYPRYQTDTALGFIRHAHNDYLEIISEIGVIGAFPLLLSAAILFVYGLKKLFNQTDKALQVIGIGALSACFSIMVHEVTDFNLHVPSNATLFAVCAAIAFVSATHGKSDKAFLQLHIKLSDEKRLLSFIAVVIICSVTLVMVLLPYIGNIYLLKAREHKANKNYNLANKYLEKAIFFDSGNVDHLVETGDIMVNRSHIILEPEKKKTFLLTSLKYYDKALNASPVRSYIYIKKALIQLQLDLFNESETSFKKAIYYFPNWSMTYYNLGSFYIRKGELSKALNEYGIFISLQRQDKNFIQYLEMALNEIWEVSKDYNELRKIIPKDYISRMFFAQYLSAKGYSTDSAKEREFALSLKPTIEDLEDSFSRKQTIDNALAHLREIYLKGEFRKALDVGKKYHMQFGDDIQLLIQIARIYEKLGDYDKAIYVYHQIILTTKDTKDEPYIYQKLKKKKFSPVWPYVNIANLYSKSNRYQEAIDTLREGLKLWPDDNHLKTKLHLEMAQDYSRQGKYNEAIATYRQLIKDGYKPSWIYTNIANFYSKSNRYQEAIDILRQGLSQWPDNIALYYRLGKEYKNNRKHQKAHDQWNKCLEISPEYIPCKRALEKSDKLELS
jgi:tetratricopeptide (TPR) repeat protein